MAFFLPPECSFQLLGILGSEVDSAQDDSCRGRFMVWLSLVTKPSHVGIRCGWASLPSALAYGP
jgi:hypothetical protein